MTLVREFNLYLTAGRTIPLVINVNQFDSGEQWAFTVYKEDGTQYIPSTGAIVGIKSDNLGIINSGTVDENGRVIITETQQMTASVGKAVFELTLDSGTHGTANFVVLVEEKPGNNADLSDSDISLIQEALNAVSPLPTGGTVGQVLTKTAQGSAWSDAGTPTQAQVAEAVSDWADEHITVETGVVIDNSLSVAGAAADSKKVGDEISDLKSTLQGVIPYDVKLAMDTLFSKMAVKDDESYTNEYQVFHAWATATNVVSISAVYTQSGTVYNTDSLDSLKTDLVVTAHYSDGTTATVTTYTLSGTLTSGTSTITVTYEGKTTTFNVTVTEYIPSDYTLLDYVWSYGNSASTPIYVATGVIPTASTSVEYKASRDTMPTSVINNNGGHLCSCENFVVPFLRYYQSKMEFFTNRGGTRVESNSVASLVSADTPFEVSAFVGGNGVTLNGENLMTASYGGTAPTKQLTLFTYDGDTATTSSMFVGKLYGMKIYEGSTLIREYVPCKNPSNVVGLYDRVNQTFVGSATANPLSAPAQ